MAARDHYEIKVTCTGCDEIAVIEISEDDFPFMKRANQKVEHIKGDFTAEKRADFLIAVHCMKCGQETLWRGK
jgi:hypothetical protein